MVDEIDVASERELEANERLVLLARDAAAPETHEDFDGVGCVECGEAMPEGRLKLGRVRCVPCQEYKEQNEKFYRR